MYRSNNLDELAITYDKKEFTEIEDVRELDYASHTRMSRLNKIIVLLNKNGYFAAVKILEVKSRSMVCLELM